MIRLVLISIIDCTACAQYVPLHNLCKGNNAIVFSPHKLKDDSPRFMLSVLTIKKAFLMNKYLFSSVWYGLVSLRYTE